MVLISSSWWAAGGRVGRLRIWQRAQLPGPRAVDWLRRRAVSGQCTLAHKHTHTHTQTAAQILEGALSYKDGILEHKVRHLHDSEIEQRK